MLNMNRNENRGKQFCVVDQFLFTMIPAGSPFKETTALVREIIRSPIPDNIVNLKMISCNSFTLAFCFALLPLATGTSFKYVGFGGGYSSQNGVFAASTVLGSGSPVSIGTAASDDIVSGSTSVISPVEATESDELSPPIGSPEVVSNIELSSILGRGLQADVPDYREASASPGQTYTTSDSGNRKTKSNKNVSLEKAGNAPVPKVCWTMSKRCCYEEVQKGYECKDFYAYKYARCHPVIAYERICGEIKERPANHPRPKGRVKYEETVLKNYDARYGPHVAGYPADGESEYYKTDTIPAKPHGVSGTPFPTPQSYQSGSGGVANNGYEATGSDGNTLSVPPYQTANNVQAPGPGSSQEENTAKPMHKTSGSTANTGSTYKVNAQPNRSHGKTLKAKSDSMTGATGQEQAPGQQTSYGAGAAPVSPLPENGPSYRVVAQV